MTTVSYALHPACGRCESTGESRAGIGRSIMLYSLLRPALFLIEPETAHSLALTALKALPLTGNNCAADTRAEPQCRAAALIVTTA